MLNFLYFSLSVFVFPLLLGAGVGLAQVCFSSATSYPADNESWAVTNADFNGDGKTNLATANYSSNNVSVLLGTGTGNFGFAINFSVGTGSSLLNT